MEKTIDSDGLEFYRYNGSNKFILDILEHLLRCRTTDIYSDDNLERISNLAFYHGWEIIIKEKNNG